MVDSSTPRSRSKGSEVSRIEMPLKPKQEMYTTWPDMIKHWPKTTLCIVSNEFCERFSYYGMRTVLILYLLNVLKFTDNQSTIFFNSFTVLCYTTPLLGSIVADGYIGKFWTIFTVSILYAAGQVILALASTQNQESSVHPWMDMSGLLIIGFGTGGIKPCVSAFGADQFDQGQERMLSLFFSMFYFSINAGSMISTFISPLFRSQPCLGQDSCYPLAFGIPAILMVLATAIFMAGSFWYKKPPVKDNVFGEVARLMGRAISNKGKATKKHDHWLDYYLDNHDCANDPRCLELQAEKHRSTVCQKANFIDDVKSLLRVLVMFLPVPMFWALYDQQGSVWLIQGIQMDCRVGSILILPDQMQTLNAILILLFIPLFQVVIYPICSYFIELTPLRKMVAGGLIASLAFLITGFVQLQVNTTLPPMPSNGQAYVSVWNQIPNCVVTASYGGRDAKLQTGVAMVDSKKNGATTFHVAYPSGKAKKDTTWDAVINLSYGNGCPANLPKSHKITVKNQKVFFVGVNVNGVYDGQAKPDKPTQGTGEFSMSIITAMDKPFAQNFAMCRIDKNTDKNYPCNPKRPADFYYWETWYNRGTDDRLKNATYDGGNQPGQTAVVYDFKPVKPGKWELFYMYNTPKNIDTPPTMPKEQVKVKTTHFIYDTQTQGAVNVFALTGSLDTPTVYKWELVHSNSVNILWQVPQIVTITAAEILFSITGYEFAYSQSAPSMKALVQALWLLTTAIGDSIIVLITALNLFTNMATQFFVYAAVMAIVIVIFALLSIFYYEYNYYTKGEDDEETDRLTERSNDNLRESFSFSNKGYLDELEPITEDTRF
ncbi:unnamed protein product [Auanema sp. JU1783]|nr:unnamed protein product [Auanema sp. JU1783]